jgi:hypothetical protein
MIYQAGLGLCGIEHATEFALAVCIVVMFDIYGASQGWSMDDESSSVVDFPDIFFFPLFVIFKFHLLNAHEIQAL